ncbi:MAG: PepSY domain-containing protein, partial [Woeseiaceae bacterium]
ADRSPGRQARSWIRFLHTGEALGFFGQTIAGLVSLTSLFMVWTGFALAWRRLVSPLLPITVGTRARRPL